MKSKENFQDQDRKLTFLEKVLYQTNGMFGTFYFQMMQMYLLFFYTDIFKIDPLYIAGLFLVARIVDAVVAPVVGIYLDKVSTPWGKYKPWILIFAIPIAVIGWMTFTVVDLSSAGKLVYVTSTYFIFSAAMAASQAPGAALLPTMTKRLDDRVSLGVIGYILAIVGALFVSIGALPIINILGRGNQAKGFSYLTAIVGVIYVLAVILQMFVLKEKYIDTSEKTEKHSVKEIFMGVAKNKPAVITYIIVFVMNLANGVKSAIMIIYFTYYFHDQNLMVIMGIVGLIPTMIGTFLSPIVTKKIGIKNNLFMNTIVTIITTAGVIFIPATQSGTIAFTVLAVIGSLFSGISMPAQGTLMPAAMDYSEWKFGITANGFMGSLQGFIQNLATAVSGAIAAGSLSLIKYAPGTEQSSGTLFWLKALMSIIPAIIFAGMFVIVKFDLTEEKQKEMTHELAERRKAAAEVSIV